MERKTIQINESTIADITLRKGEADVVITDSTGRHETTVQLGSAESAVLSMLFGDTAAIGFGGTDSWGRNRLPLNLGYENGSVMTDSVMVDNITVQQTAGDGNWCRCEVINNGAAVQYTALSDNPSTQPRTAYFTHYTTDTTIKRGFNEGRKALSAWTVTVIQAGNPNGSVEPEPSDISTEDDARLRAVYAACANSPQPADATTNHQPTTDNPGFFTIRIVNNSGKRIMHNGRFKFFTSDGEERVGYYREPSESPTGSEFWYYLNPTNYVLEKGATLNITVPVKRTTPQYGTIQDLTGKSLSKTTLGRMYFSTPNKQSDNLLHNSSLIVVDPSGLTDVAIAAGKTFTMQITAALMAGSNYYLADDFNYDAAKAYFRHVSGSETVLVPMRLIDWK